MKLKLTFLTCRRRRPSSLDDGGNLGVVLERRPQCAVSHEVRRRGKKSVVVMPDTQKVLENMGEQIKMARLRRNLSTELVAERAGISRATLWAVEKGTPTVAIGTYAAVLHALGGMDKDLELVAQDDEFGRRMQDMNLVTPKRAKRK